MGGAVEVVEEVVGGGVRAPDVDEAVADIPLLWREIVDPGLSGMVGLLSEGMNKIDAVEDIFEANLVSDEAGLEGKITLSDALGNRLAVAEGEGT